MKEIILRIKYLFRDCEFREAGYECREDCSCRLGFKEWKERRG